MDELSNIYVGPTAPEIDGIAETQWLAFIDTLDVMDKQHGSFIVLDTYSTLYPRVKLDSYLRTLEFIGSKECAI